MQVNNSTSVRHSAASAIAPSVGVAVGQNCFGDAGASGGFSAAISTFGWGVSAGATKPANICAVYAVGGPAAAAAYLSAMDPAARRALIAAGVVTTPSRVKAGQTAQQARVTCPATHPVYVEGKGCRK